MGRGLTVRLSKEGRVMSDLVRPRPIYGALRTRVVAKLAGVSLRQLWYWHNTGLIQAHAFPGARGYPRLYSWVDYMKIRAIRKLLAEGVATKGIRATIDYLEENVPEWYRMPLYGFSGRALIELESGMVTADAGRQSVLPLVKDVLRELREEGPLGKLRRFSDYIDMNPDVLSGSPVIKGTRIETRFVAALVNDYGMSVDSVAEGYRVAPVQVRHAIDFDRATA